MKWQDFKSVDKAAVYRSGMRVGELSRTQRGCMFDYLPVVSVPDIAFHLPLSQKHFEFFGDNLPPFFAGLIPEGLRLNNLIKRIKTSESDLFSLLLAVGTDAIGDVAVVPHGVNLSELNESIPAIEPKYIGKVVFRELLEKSLNPKGTEFERLETQLPGFQDKVSSSVISIPLKAASRWHSYILKLNPVDKPLLVENEFFFLNVARACGFRIPKIKLVKDTQGESGLLVERFDRRVVQKNGEVKILKIHQEDGCQFLNRYPADKYRLSFAELADGVALWASAPKVELMRLTELMAFSYIIANGDLHAKNVSLWRPTSGTHVELTPVYDVLTTLPYGDDHMALKLDGRDDNIKRKHIIDFGLRFSLPAKATQSMLDKLLTKIAPWIDEVEKIGFDKRKMLHLKKIIQKRVRDIKG